MTWFAVLLQSPIRIDGTIPLWGLLGLTGMGILTAIMSIITLRDAVAAHERLDETRFDLMTAQITESHRELREDIRGIRDR